MQQKNPKQTSFTQKGFTLIEMLVVVSVIGIVLLLAAPSLSNVTSGATSKQVYDFAQTANRNWRLLNMKCGTTNDTATSPVVAAPITALKSLSLIINGSGVLNTGTYQSCWNEAGLVALHNKATGNVTDGFKVAGFPVSWSGGSGTTPISFVFTGVPTEIALPLYKQYSSAVGAQTATTIPAAADATDPMIQHTLPASGTVTLTFLFQ